MGAWQGRPARWAHPHVCGEHSPQAPAQQQQQGSSPRMRGTPQQLHKMQLIEGLIPTYAGNTLFGNVPGGAHGAHPHVCGEHVESSFGFSHD